MKSTTYALFTVVVAGLIATTITATDATSEKWVEIQKVKDGKHWYPFEDGMAIDATQPTFRGISGGIESVQITLDGHQVGTNKVSDTGKISKLQKWPLEHGTYEMIVRDCGAIVEKGNVGACTQRGADLSSYAVLFNGTIRIGPEPVATEEPGAMEAMKAKIAELKATITALEGTIMEMLERMDSVNTPNITAAERPPLQLPESVPGQYYIRLVNATANATYNLGDRIHFEAKAPPCVPTYGLDGTTVAQRGGWTEILIKTSLGHSFVFHNGCMDVIDQTHYMNRVNLNSTLDHSTISGDLEVTGKMVAGEYALWLNTGRDGVETDDYYSDKFTLK